MQEQPPVLLDKIPVTPPLPLDGQRERWIPNPRGTSWAEFVDHYKGSRVPHSSDSSQRTTCPLSLDTLDDHWNSNSYSSDDNILKNSSLKHTNCPYRAPDGNNSCSEISCTDMVNPLSSKSHHKSIFGDERSKDHSDKLIASLSIENNAQGPENLDMFVDKSQKSGTKRFH